MKRTLLIDDMRTMEADETARTAREGMEALMSCEFTHLLLDNDLGSDFEGRHILKWAIENQCVPDNVLLVTSNPVARRAMEDMLKFDLEYNHNRSTGWWSNDD